MSDRDPNRANPIQQVIDGAKKLFGGDSESPKPTGSPDLRNEAQQREADDRFEAEKAKDARR